MVSLTIKDRIENIRINSKNSIKFILYFTILSGTLIDVFHFPSALLYLNDALLILAILFGFRKLINSMRLQSPYITIALVFYTLLCFISSIISAVNPILMLWAFRNTFRGIIYFELIICFIDKNDLKKIFNAFFYIQIISLILSIYQVFVLKHPQDAVGGIFGYGNGAGVNTFGILCCSYYLIYYLKNKHGGLKAIIISFASLAIAALAEEKIFFVYFIILLFVILLFSHINRLKKLIIIVISILSIYVALIILKELYPTMYEIMIDLDSFMEYATITYEEGYMLPRIGSFKVINSLFFDGERQLLLGIGFGNSEMSAFFKSDFYRMYGNYNYRWFTHQWTFIETGILGFVSYLAFFVAILFANYKSSREAKNSRYIFSLISMVCTLCMIVSMWINATLKVDMCYLAFFSMAVGLIAKKNLQIS